MRALMRVLMRAPLLRIVRLGGAAAVACLMFGSADAPAAATTTWQRAPIFGGDIRTW